MQLLRGGVTAHSSVTGTDHSATENQIDLNSDLGEGFGHWGLGNDEDLLNVVTSGNIACGFHAGDASTMRKTCALASKRNVVIGAHIGYRDLAGFGRRRIDYDFEELRDDLLYQIGALEAFARLAGARVRYVKPHGALYNSAVVDTTQAHAVVEALRSFSNDLALLCPAGSVVAEMAQEVGIIVVREGFIDRAYEPDGRLVPRRRPGAMIIESEVAAQRAVQMAVEKTVTAIDGSVLPYSVDSLCIHGDTHDAAGLARAARRALVAAGVAISSFI
jgi:UPF0271 protein